MTAAELELAGWRRQMSDLYASVRASGDPEQGHAQWREGRDELFRNHSQSPLPPDDPMRASGIPYWPYDRTLRFELPLTPAEAVILDVPTDGDGTTSMQQIGHVGLPPPFAPATIAVWWLRQYGGGLFLPLRDETAGDSTYGGGRYLLDTAKGADLGGTRTTVVVDLNFLYHPSCRYNSRWQCPLAPPGNVLSHSVRAGERL